MFTRIFSGGVTAVFVTQVERVVTIMQNPRQYKIPDWFLNRQKDVKDGKYSQVSGFLHSSSVAVV